MRKNKILISALLFIAFLNLSCHKDIFGRINVHFLDKVTRQPIVGISVRINEYSSMYDTQGKTKAGGITDNNGVFSFAKNKISNTNHQVNAFMYGDYSDSTSVSYQYLTDNIILDLSKSDAYCYGDPSGRIVIETEKQFWDSKNYDTLLIKSSSGEDTLIKDIKLGRGYDGKSGVSVHFNFYSLRNTKQDSVYSANYKFECFPVEEMKNDPFPGYHFLLF